VNKFIVQNGRDQQVVLYWYWAQGRAVAGEMEARTAMIRSAILRNRTDGAIIRVSSPVYRTVAETTDWLVQYVQQLDAVLGDFLPA